MPGTVTPTTNSLQQGSCPSSVIFEGGKCYEASSTPGGGKVFVLRKSSLVPVDMPSATTTSVLTLPTTDSIQFTQIPHYVEDGGGGDFTGLINLANATVVHGQQQQTQEVVQEEVVQVQQQESHDGVIQFELNQFNNQFVVNSAGEATTDSGQMTFEVSDSQFQQLQAQQQGLSGYMDNVNFELDLSNMIVFEEPSVNGQFVPTPSQEVEQSRIVKPTPPPPINHLAVSTVTCVSGPNPGQNQFFILEDNRHRVDSQLIQLTSSFIENKANSDAAEDAGTNKGSKGGTGNVFKIPQEPTTKKTAKERAAERAAEKEKEKDRPRPVINPEEIASRISATLDFASIIRSAQNGKKDQAKTGNDSGSKESTKSAPSRPQPQKESPKRSKTPNGPPVLTPEVPNPPPQVLQSETKKTPARKVKKVEEIPSKARVSDSSSKENKDSKSVIEEELKEPQKAVTSCFNCGCYGLEEEFIIRQETQESFCTDSCLSTSKLSENFEERQRGKLLSILGKKEESVSKKNNGGKAKTVSRRSSSTTSNQSGSLVNKRGSNSSLDAKEEPETPPKRTSNKRNATAQQKADRKKSVEQAMIIHSKRIAEQLQRKSVEYSSVSGGNSPSPSTSSSQSLGSQSGGKGSGKQQKQPEIEPFDWGKYLKETNSKGAPTRLFRKPAFPSGNPFTAGKVLEAIDPQHPSLICACSIAEVRGYRLRLHFIGYPDSYDFWVNADSDEIFPCGWCEDNGFELQPPPGYSPKEFSWHVFMVEELVNATQRGDFACTKDDPMIQSGIKEGMKLEAVDIKNQNHLCVASVSKVIGEKFLVHFDSWSDTYDYYVDPTSPHIHPVGWAAQNNVTLTPPNGMAEFNWDTYMSDTGTYPMPLRLFRPLPPVGFKKGMKIECVDKRNPINVRVATIADVDEHNLLIHFDGWPEIYDYKVEEISRDIHPPGWCAETGHPLQPPPGTGGPGSSEWNGACPVFGCNGIGHIRGPKFSFHNSEKNCPYSTQNFMKESFFMDRIVYQLTVMKTEDKMTKKVEDLSDSSRESSPEIPVLELASKTKSSGKGKGAKRGSTTSSASANKKLNFNKGKKDEVKPELLPPPLPPTPPKVERLPPSIVVPELKEPEPVPELIKSTSKPVENKPTKAPPKGKPVKRPISSIELLESRIKEGTTPALKKKKKKVKKPKVEKNVEQEPGEIMLNPPPAKKSRPSIEEKIPSQSSSSSSSSMEDIEAKLEANLGFLKKIIGRLNEKTVESWNSEQVAEFVSKIPGCELHVQPFVDSEIDGEAFLLLLQQDISNLKIKFGPTLKIAHAIKLIQRNSSSKT